MNRTIKEPLSSASTLRAINSFESISRTSSTPITSDVASKTLKGLTPFEYICKSWTSQP